mmetsp:Transcript_24241/g.47670  ORF Transcript_24241/g.47670 Transcript_24241/m.47670 type:complete len:482 (+) Transcript_24241:63-1508(+)|eukprot:CAMPEP_0175122152 /NCGR_PEP_ID=MMETSP0087-20121206/1564_1 /TAXON_ID=136419 /ORGANISM="Unknown Unknown, Strain D1" /LENGTH=481 /DNA_ID=CAMNT_0016403771 /DNA_START=68 /DNA_END=1513 /DNA_ORIENTATION=-
MSARPVQQQHDTAGVAEMTDQLMAASLADSTDTKRTAVARNCRFFQLRACKFGDACAFRHDDKQVNMKACWFFQRSGSCKFGDGCKFLHQDRRTNPTIKKSNVSSAHFSTIDKSKTGDRDQRTTGNMNSSVGGEKHNHSRCISRRKLLCVDALNFGRGFFCGSTRNICNARVCVRKFVFAARSSGYEPEVFLDAQSSTEETIKKWRKRREAEVRTGKKGVVHGMTEIIGDCFRENGVTVHYSVEDNDDTMASHAAHRQGDVLSQDRDFFRYHPRPYRVFEGFNIKHGKLHLNVHTNNTPKAGVSCRPLAPTAITTASTDPMLIGLLNSRRYIRGVPCAGLVKERGNTHSLFRPLRQAMYARLAPRFQKEDEKNLSIEEEFPCWNDANGKVEWKVTQVEALAKHDKLLSDPAKAVEAFGSLRQTDSPTDVVDVWMCCLEIIRQANPEGPSLLELFTTSAGSPGLSMKPTSKTKNYPSPHFRN